MENFSRQQTQPHVTRFTSTQTSYLTCNPIPPNNNNQIYQYSTHPTVTLDHNQDFINGGNHNQDFINGGNHNQDFINGGDSNNEGANYASSANDDQGVSNISGKEIITSQDEEVNYIIGVKEEDYFKALPSGYRFEPQDHELIQDYLEKRIANVKLPHNLIKLVNLYQFTPRELTDAYPEMGERKWYFFTHRDRKYQNGSRPNRAAGTGYWKATGKDKTVLKDGNSGPRIGFRKALVFYDGRPKSESNTKTNWIMHEYRVDQPPKRIRTSQNDMRLDDYVLCKIIKKPDKTHKQPDKTHKRSRSTSSNDSQENLNNDMLEGDPNEFNDPTKNINPQENLHNGLLEANPNRFIDPMKNIQAPPLMNISRLNYIQYPPVMNNAGIHTSMAWAYDIDASVTRGHGGLTTDIRSYGGLTSDIDASVTEANYGGETTGIDAPVTEANYGGQTAGIDGSVTGAYDSTYYGNLSRSTYRIELDPNWNTIYPNQAYDVPIALPDLYQDPNHLPYGTLPRTTKESKHPERKPPQS